MRQITSRDRERFRRRVEKEFPGDEMMQELHLIRLIHHQQMRGLSRKERIRFYDVAQDASTAKAAIPVRSGCPRS